MMDETKNAVRRLWADAFGESESYLDMYFSRVYQPGETLTLCDGFGKIVSSVLLQSYSLDFQNQLVKAGYIAGAVTDRNARNNGYMTRLLVDALAASRERGDVIDFLIPSSRHLFFFYDRLGFSTVFYVDRRHYVAGSVFKPVDTYTMTQISLPLSGEFISAFESMEAMRKGAVRHTPQQIDNIVRDNQLDGGNVLACLDGEGAISSISFIVMSRSRLTVKDLLSRDEDARKGMLEAIVRKYPSTPITHLAPPVSPRPYQAIGMGRIVNAESALRFVAANNSGFSGAIRIKDQLLPDNDHTYILDSGSLSIDDKPRKKYDLDVTIDVLTSILFSSRRIGEIFRLCTSRPYLSLMLD